MTKVAKVREPESYVEASQDAKWQSAMEEEMWALDVNNTWDLVDPPRHWKQIRCKWVYKVKYNVDGSVNRYKVWLVDMGYTQTHNIDYDETFTQVAKMTSVRVVLAVAAAMLRRHYGSSVCTADRDVLDR